MPSRLARLRKALSDRQLDAALIWARPNVRYLSGFTGTEGTLLVTAKDALFLSDSRYTEQAGQQVAPNGFAVITFKQKFKEIAAQVMDLGVRTLGVEDESMTVSQHKTLSDELNGVKLAPLGRLATRLREIKDAVEIEAIRRAVWVQEEALRAILPLVRPGAKEWDVALALEVEMRRLGALTVSFDTIVGSGPRGAMPHGTASDKVIEPGEMVVIDWGAVVGGYCSDQTVTVSVGKPADPEAEQVYEIVRAAQATCIKGIRPGMEMKEIDKLARDVIAAAGYGDLFGHGTGHALGLEIHEEPRVSALGAGTATPGMVFTVEPGVYLPGRFGVRVEDIVLVTAQGAECLTTIPKDLRSTI